MSGLVAAGVGVVGLLMARGLLDIPVLIEQDGALVGADSWRYASIAFLAAPVATALLHLLFGDRSSAPHVL